MDARSGEMAVFVQVVEAGSFSAAADVLSLTPSAVSKLVTRIEERLGVQLFHRSTRRLVITNEGQDYYQSCLRILEDIEDAEQSISGDTATPRGLLRVNVSLPFGIHYLVPLVSEFSKQFPKITVDVSLSDTLVDLQRDRVDVAIRMGTLLDGSFRARPLGKSRRAVVASPSYLAAHGRPSTPDDLMKHRCVDFSFRKAQDGWPFRVSEQNTSVAIRGGVLTNNGETARQLTIGGAGIGRLGMFHVARDIEAGRLVEVLEEYNPRDLEDIHAIFSPRRHLALRVRVFVDFLVERLTPALARYAD